MNNKNENNLDNLENNTFAQEISTKNKAQEKIEYNKDNNNIYNDENSSNTNLNNINDNNSNKEKINDLKKFNILPSDIIKQSDNDESKQIPNFNLKLNSSFDKIDINKSFDECISNHKMNYSFVFFAKKYFSFNGKIKKKTE